MWLTYHTSSSIVPSRSRNTACRFEALGTLPHLEPASCRFAHVGSLNSYHAAMVDGAFAKKARTAMHGMTHQRAKRSHGSRSIWIRRAEYRNHRKADRRRDMHGS